LVKAIWNNDDVHKIWTLKIAKAYPKFVGGDISVLEDEKILKKYRDIVKNGWVFSGFYGSSQKKRSEDLNIPIEIIATLDKEFWTLYKGVQDWQNGFLKSYDLNGYIITLTGRRLNMYLDHGQIINYPIQSASGDIVMDAYNRISTYAQQTEQWKFQPILSIHDDLSFYLPQNSWKEDVEIISKIMLEYYYDFLIVPLTLEVAVGPNWFECQRYKDYSNGEWLNSKIKN
jgi:DNA polymerase I-like protein with 3'-5' exonuclease and polymerase domains